MGAPLSLSRKTTAFRAGRAEASVRDLAMGDRALGWMRATFMMVVDTVGEEGLPTEAAVMRASSAGPLRGGAAFDQDWDRSP